MSIAAFKGIGGNLFQLFKISVYKRPLDNLLKVM